MSSGDAEQEYPFTDPRIVLGEAITSAIKHSSEQVPADAYLTRWVVVGELALPSDKMAFVQMSSTASGLELKAWDEIGFHATALIRSALRGIQ